MSQKDLGGGNVGKLVSISEAADFLGVSVATLRRWDASGKIEAVRKGRNRFFLQEELDRVKSSRPMKISEAASTLGFSSATLRRLEDRGLLIPERDENGERLYSDSLLDEFRQSEYYLKKRARREAQTRGVIKDDTNATVITSVGETAKKASAEIDSDRPSDQPKIHIDGQYTSLYSDEQPFSLDSDKQIVVDDLLVGDGAPQVLRDQNRVDAQDHQLDEKIAHDLVEEMKVFNQRVADLEHEVELEHEIREIDEAVIENQVAVSQLSRSRWVLFLMMSVVGTSFALLLFLITGMFMLFPEDTARYFGYDIPLRQVVSFTSPQSNRQFILQSSGGRVLGIEDGGSARDEVRSDGELSRTARILRPLSRASLGIVGLISDVRYERALSVQEPLFVVRDDGSLEPLRRLAIPNESFMALGTVDSIANLDADFVDGREPGTGPDNLLFLNSDGDLEIEGAIISSSLGPASIGDGTVTEFSIANGSLVARYYAKGSIGTDALRDDSVKSIDIADGTIRDIDLADNSVTADKLAGGSVHGEHIVEDAITSKEVAEGAVGTVELQDGSITTDDIKNGTITAEDLAAGAVSVDSIEDNSLDFIKFKNDLGLDAGTSIDFGAHDLTLNLAGTGGLNVTGTGAVSVESGSVTLSSFQSCGALTTGASGALVCAGSVAVADDSLDYVKLADVLNLDDSTTLYTGGLTYTLDLDTTGLFQVTGGQNITGSLDVTGDTDISGALSAGSVTSSGSLSVDGFTHLTRAVLQGDSSVVGDLEASTLTSNGAITGTGSLSVEGAATFSDAITVVGTTTLTGAITTDTSSISLSAFTGCGALTTDATGNLVCATAGTVADDSLDFAQFVDAMNLDANTTVNTGGLTYTIDLDTTGLFQVTGSQNITGSLDITGDLDVSGRSTLTGDIDTTFTQGSIVFAGINGELYQDNSGLFYDNLNNRIGIGTTTPNAPLDVNGNAIIDGSLTTSTIQANGNITGTGNLSIDGFTHLTNTVLQGDSSVVGTLEASEFETTGNITGSGNLSIDGTSILNGATAIGSNTVAPGLTLDITGDTNLTGSVDITGDLHVSGNTTFAGGLSCSDCLDFDSFDDQLDLDANTTISTGGQTLTLDLDTTGLFQVTGGQNITGSLDVTGDTDISGALSAGSVTSSGSLSVDGFTHLTRAVLQGDSSVVGDLEASTLTSNGAITGTGSLSVEGAATFSDAITVVGTTTLTGAITTDTSSISLSAFTGCGALTTDATGNLVCATAGTVADDSLDFAQFVDAMNLDANTTVNTGGLTYTIDLDTTGLFQVTGSQNITGSLDITGDLDVSGRSTLTGDIDTTFTQGSIVFAGINGELYQDNSGLFYDNLNNRIGIGTTTPNAPLDVNGNAIIDGSLTTSTIQANGNITGTGNLSIDGFTHLTNTVLQGDSSVVGTLEASEFETTGNITGSGNLSIDGTSILNGATAIGSNTVAPGLTLDITGDTNLTGSVDITGDLHVSGNTTFAGGLSCSDCLDFDSFDDQLDLDANTTISTGGQTLTLDLDTTGLFQVTGGQNITGSLDVTGDTDISGALSAGSVTSSGSLSVDGFTHLTRAVLQGDSSVVGDLEASTLTSNGAITGTGSLSVEGAATFSDAITVVGTTTLTGAITTDTSSISLSAFTGCGALTTDATGNLVCATAGTVADDSLDFAQFVDAMNLDANTTVNTGGLTYTIDLDTTGLFQVTGSQNITGSLDITGDLDVSGRSTLTGDIDTTFTQGSIVFAGINGELYQDNSGLFYDNLNNRIGIGTTTPNAPLDVNGNAIIDGSLTTSTIQANGNITGTGNLSIDGFTHLTNTVLQGDSSVVGTLEASEFETTGNITGSGNLSIDGTSILNGATAIGSNTVAPGLTLDITGDTNLTGSVDITGDLHVSGNTTFAGGLSCSDCLDFDSFDDQLDLDANTTISTGGQTLTLDLDTTGLFQVTGGQNITGSLDVTGDTDISGALSAGSVTSSGSLSVDGFTHLTRAVLQGDSSVVGDLEASTLTSNGAITGTGSLSVEGAATFSDAITVVGTTTLTGAITTDTSSISLSAFTGCGALTTDATGNLVCATAGTVADDSLDFAQFVDAMNLDANTTVNTGGLTYTIDLDTTGLFQVTGSQNITGSLDITGDLDVSGRSTLTGDIDTTFTQGSIVFAGINGELYQDNSGLFYDNLNNRIGIGTTTPNAPLDVNGNAIIDGSLTTSTIQANGNITGTGNLSIDGFTHLTNTVLQGDSSVVGTLEASEFETTGNITGSGNLSIDGTSILNGATAIGSNTVAPGLTLDITGDTNLTGSVDITGDLHVSGNTTFAGGLSCSDCLDFDSFDDQLDLDANTTISTGGQTLTLDLDTTGLFQVTGGQNITGSLDVTGDTDISGALSAGSVTSSGSLSVDGFTHLTRAVLQGDSSVVGDLEASTLTSNGAITGTGSLSVEGAATFSDAITVVGTTTLTGAITTDTSSISLSAFTGCGALTTDATGNLVCATAGTVADDSLDFAQFVDAMNLDANTTVNTGGLTYTIDLDTTGLFQVTGSQNITGSLDITGDLDVSGRSTLTGDIDTTFTQGSIVFAGINGELYQDNSGLFYDNLNNRIGIGTTTPNAPLDVNGNAIIDGSLTTSTIQANGNITGTGNLSIDGFTHLTNTVLQGDSSVVGTLEASEFETTGNITGSGNLSIDGTSILNGATAIGSNTVAPGLTLDITGDTNLTGSVDITGDLHVSGNTTFAGGLSCSDCLDFDSFDDQLDLDANTTISTGGQTLTLDLDTTGLFQVTGGQNITGSLDVTGDTDISGALSAGSVTSSGSLSVDGFTHLTRAVLQGDSSVVGDLEASTLTSNGAITGTGSLSVEGAATFSDAITVVGTTTLTGAITTDTSSISLSAFTGCGALTTDATGNLVCATAGTVADDSLDFAQFVDAMNLDANTTVNTGGLTYTIDLDTTGLFQVTGSQNITGSLDITGDLDVSGRSTLTGDIDTTFTQGSIVFAGINGELYQDNSGLFYDNLNNRIGIGTTTPNAPLDVNGNAIIDGSLTTSTIQANGNITGTGNLSIDGFTHLTNTVLQGDSSVVGTLEASEFETTGNITGSGNLSIDGTSILNGATAIGSNTVAPGLTLDITGDTNLTGSVDITGDLHVSGNTTFAGGLSCSDCLDFDSFDDQLDLDANTTISTGGQTLTLDLDTTGLFQVTGGQNITGSLDVTGDTDISGALSAGSVTSSGSLSVDGFTHLTRAVLQGDSSVVGDLEASTLTSNGAITGTGSLSVEGAATFSDAITVVGTTTLTGAITTDTSSISLSAFTGCGALTTDATGNLVCATAGTVADDSLDFAQFVDAMNLDANTTVNTGGLTYTIDLDTTGLFQVTGSQNITGSLDITGDLDVSGRSTLTGDIDTTFTQGSIVFAGINGELYQDNSGLFYDNLNNRIGIGTTTPNAPLDVNGNAIIDGSLTTSTIQANGNITGTGNLSIDGFTHLTNTVLQGDSSVVGTLEASEFETTGNITGSGNLSIDGTSILNGATAIGSNTVAPGLTLDITGDTNLTGSVDITGDLHVSGNTTFAGGLSCSDCLDFDSFDDQLDLDANTTISTGGQTLTLDLDTTGLFQVTGGQNITGSLDVTGDTDISGALSAGSVTSSGSLSVDGFTHLTRAVLQGDSSVVGDLEASTLTSNGAITGTGSLSVEGAATFSDAITVVGTTTLTGAITTDTSSISLSAFTGCGALTTDATGNLVCATAGTVADDSLDFAQFVDAMNLDANTTVNTGGLTYTIDLDTTGLFQVTGSQNITGSLDITGDLDVSGRSTLTGDIDTTFTQGSIVFAGINGELYQDNSGLFYDNLNNRIGIGTTTPNAPLDVNGNAIIDGSLTTSTIQANGNITGTGNLSIDGFTHLTNTVLQGDSSVVGTLEASEFETTGNITGSGNLSIDGTSILNGATAIGSNTVAPGLTLDITGDTNLTGSVDITGDLHVSGNTTFAGGLSCSDCLDFDSFDDQLDLDANTTISTGGQTLTLDLDTTGLFQVTGGQNITGSLDVTGDTDISGALSAGSVTSSGSLSVDGFTHLTRAVLQGDSSVVGDLEASTLTSNGAITGTGSLSVEGAATFSDAITVVGTTTLTGAITTDTSSISLSAFTGCGALTTDATGNLVCATAGTVADDSLDFAQFVDAMNLDANTTVNTGGLTYTIDLDTTGLFQVTGSQNITGSLDITGDLDVSGRSTLTGDIDTTFTQGSIVFAGINGELYQDNSGLFYDNLNNRIGIGTTTPNAPLDVNGNAIIDGSLTTSTIQANGNITGTGNLSIDGFTHLTNTVLQGDSSVVGTLEASEFETTGNITGSGNLSIDGTSILNGATAIGSNTVAPGLTLDITGDTNLTGSVDITGDLHVSGNTTFAGGLSCSDCLDFDSFDDQLDLDANTTISTGGQTLTLDLDTTGLFQVTGGQNITGSLDVTGDTDISGALSAGSVTSSGSLSVDGFTHLTRAVLQGDSSVVGDLEASTLTSNGAITGTGSLSVEGAATFSDAITVVGTTTLTGAITTDTSSISLSAFTGCGALTTDATGNLVCATAGTVADDSLDFAQFVDAMNLDANTTVNTGGLTYTIDLDTTGLFQVTGSQNITGSLDITGDLDVSGRSTLTGDIDTTFTQGSIVFAGINGELYQDNSGLFYDNLNNRIGIGTTTPNAPLDVNGNAIIDGSLTTSTIQANGNITGTGNLSIDGFTHLTNTVLQGDSSVVGTLEASEFETTGNITGSGNLSIDGTSILNGATAIGSNTVAPGLTLDITGDTNLTGSVDITGDLHVSGNTTFAGGLSCSDCLDFDSFDDQLDLDANTTISTGGQTLTLDLDTTGLFQVTGGQNITGSLDVTGDTDISGALSAGSVTSSGSLSVDGFTHLTRAVLQGDSSVVGDLEASTLTSNGAITGTGSLSVEGAATFSDAITVVGTTTLTGAITTDTSSISLSAFTGCGALTTDATGNLVCATAGTVADDSLDFAQFVDAMNLDANTTVNTGGLTYTIDLDTTGLFQVTGSQNITGSLDITGDLDVSGRSTLTGDIDTTFTQGSIVFAGINGELYQDNSGLFYDNLNNRIGIGTTTPNAPLDVNGNAIIDGSLTTSTIQANGNITGTGNLSIDGFTHLTNTVLQGDSSVVGTLEASEFETTGNITGSGNLSIDGTSILNGATAIGSNTVAPGLTLDITGDTNLTGSVDITGDLHVSGNTTFAGGLSCSDCLDFDSFDDQLDLDANTTISTGGQTLTLDLDTTGLFQVTGGQNITGSLDITGTQSITDTTTEGALFLNQDGNGIALRIDSESTTANIIDITTPTTTTANIIDVSADTLTTGSIADFTSNSADTSTRSLVNIVNDNAAAEHAVALRLQQDSTGNAFEFYDGASLAVSIADGGDVATTGSIELSANVTASGSLSVDTASYLSGTSDNTTLTLNQDGTSAALLVTGGSIIQNQGNPFQVGQARDATNFNGPRAIAVAGKYAYLGAATNNRVSVIDISNPNTPAVVGSVQSATELQGIRSIFTAGNYLYTAAFSGDEISIIDVSNPSAPTIVGHLADGTNLNGAHSIYVSGNYAYVVNFHDDSIRVIDVSDPTDPVIVGGLSDSTNMDEAIDIYVHGSYAYITSTASDSLAVIDISDPTNPTLAGSLIDNTNLEGARSVYVSGRYAYVTANQNDSLQVIDVSDPTNPTIVGGVVDTVNLDSANTVIVAGRYAYISSFNNDSLTIVDISDPTNPQVVRTLIDGTNLDQAVDLAVSGRYAYVNSLQNDSVTVVDIGGIDAPGAAIGSLVSDQLNVANDAIIANDLYVGNGFVTGGGASIHGSLTVDGSTDVTALKIVGGGVIFADSFTEAADATLDNHTPNIGTSWTLVTSTGAADWQVQATQNRIRREVAANSTGVLYQANATYPTADYELTIRGENVDAGADDTHTLAVRVQDANNMYAFEFTSLAGAGQIYKRVAGTWTALGAAFNGPATDTMISLRADGNTISVLYDGVEQQSVTDSDITAAGTAAVGAGAIRTATDDFNGQRYDDFTVTALDNATSLVVRDGRVGIGTEQPTDFALEVQGHIGPSVDSAFNLGSPNKRFLSSYIGPNSLHIGVAGDEAVISYDTASDELNFVINETERASIGSAGIYVQPVSSIVLTGSIDPTASTAVDGVGTAFTSELEIGDRIDVNGEVRVVTGVESDESITVDSAFTDTGNDASVDRFPSLLALRDGSGDVALLVQDTGQTSIGSLTPKDGVILDVTGNTQITGVLDVTGDADISGVLNSTSLSTGLITATGSLSVDGVSYLTDAVIQGDASLTGSLEASGNIFLPATTATSGIIYRGTDTFMHNFGATSNTFLGRSAGNLALSGGNNTGIGLNSLNGLSTGAGNVGLGSSALEALSTGSSNIAIGDNSQVDADSGSNNVSIGADSLGGLSTGSSNIALGRSAGNNITSGSENIVIGYDIDAQSATGSNQLVIGNLLFGTDIMATGTTVSTGKLGIGLTTPTERLGVSGNAYITGALDVTGDVVTDGDIFGTNLTGSGNLSIDGLSILNGATSVGGDTVAAGLILDVLGDQNIMGSLDVTGDVFIDGTLEVSSDSSGGDFIFSLNEGSGDDFIVDGTTFVIESDDNQVGIGTANPTSPLHIDIDQNSPTIMTIQNDDTGTGAYAGLFIDSDTTLGGLVGFSSNFSLPNLAGRQGMFQTVGAGFDVYAGAAGADFRVYTGGFLAANERLRVDSTGNLGLGETSPAALLDVDGNALVSGSLTASSLTVAADLVTNGNVATSGSVETSGVVVDSTDTTGADLQINNTGVYTGTGIVNIAADSATTGDLIAVSADGLTSGIGLEVTSSSTGLTGDLVHILSNGDDVGVTGSALKVGLTGASATGTALNVSNGGTGLALRINDDGTYTDTTAFVVDSVGNVGIGTTTPNAKLTVDGTATITGGLDVSGGFRGAGLTDCDTQGDRLTWDASTRQFVCKNEGLVLYGQTTANYTNDTATFSNVTDMVFTAAANSSYFFRMDVYVGADQDDDLRFRIDCPAGATLDYGVTFAEQHSTAGNEVCGTQTENLPANGNNITAEHAIISGVVTTGGTGGSIQLLARENSGTDPNVMTIYAGSSYQVWRLTGGDLAEVYYTKDWTMGPGDLVSIDDTLSAGVKLSEGAYDGKALGVISTAPGQVVGTTEDFEEGRSVAVALAGRVPVKVSLENGSIVVGDYLAASSVPGVAMKATKAGRVIGRALSALDGPIETTGSVMVFVENGTFSGGSAVDVLALAAGDDDLGYSLGGFEGAEEVVDTEETFGDEVLEHFVLLSEVEDSLSAQSDVITDRLLAAVQVVSPRVRVQHVEADTVHAREISADRIIGLEFITGQIDELAAVTEELVEGIFEESLSEDELSEHQILMARLTDLEGRIDLLEAAARISGTVAGTSSGDRFESTNYSNDPTDLLGGIIEGNSVRSVAGVVMLDLLDVVQGLTVHAPSIFFDDATFNSDVEIDGELRLSTRQVGKGIIEAGEKEVVVEFEELLSAEPVMTVSLLDSFVRHTVKSVSDRGFTVVLESEQDDDVAFSWLAVPVAELGENATGEVQDDASSGAIESEEDTVETDLSETSDEEASVADEEPDSDEVELTGSVEGTGDTSAEVVTAEEGADAAVDEEAESVLDFLQENSASAEEDVELATEELVGTEVEEETVLLIDDLLEEVDAGQ